jgi:hypothetical protein
MLKTDESEPGGQARSDAARGGLARTERIANQSEILLAFEALEPAALLRLRGYARLRIRAIGAKAHGRTDEDLLSDAFTATLGGQRRWQPAAVDFVGHLCGAMRSISSHWAEKAGTHVDFDELEEKIGGAPGSLGSHNLGGELTAGGDPERELAAKQEVAAIRRRFAEDPLVLDVIEAFAGGLKGPEIKASLGLSQKEFETAVRRLRRGVEKLARGEGEENHG